MNERIDTNNDNLDACVEVTEDNGMISVKINVITEIKIPRKVMATEPSTTASVVTARSVADRMIFDIEADLMPSIERRLTQHLSVPNHHPV